MSNETKRDVFKDVVETLNVMDGAPDDYCKELIDNYDAALPDNLPVIPEEVSDRLKQAKADKSSLRYMFASSSINMLSDWWMAKNTKNEDVFASAWLLGTWCVEETGEIVKLEAAD